MDNVVALADKEGNVVEEYFYTPYGKLISDESKIGNPYLFSGRRYDSESGLYYFRHRYYEPELGRFIQTEPKPHVFLTNLYTYVRNNPINLKDPYGLCGGNPGPTQSPDPQSSAFEIFSYKLQNVQEFKIYRSGSDSFSFSLNLPYIPSYFYANFEDFFFFAPIIIKIGVALATAAIIAYFLEFILSKTKGGITAPEAPGTESPFPPDYLPTPGR